MSLVLHCLEPSSHPRRVSLGLAAGDSVAVYLLADSHAGEGGLRAVVLRPAEALPPAGAALLCTLDASGGGVTPLRVSRVGRVPVDLLRHELRSRLTAGLTLRGECRLEATPPGQRRVLFALQLDTGVGQPEARAAIAGSGTRRSQVLAASRGALWLIPTAWALLTDFSSQVVNNATSFLGRLGLSPRTAVWVVMWWFFAAGGVYAFYTQSGEKDAAAAEATANAAQAEANAAGRAVALSAERACLTERSDLAARLGEVEAQTALEVEAALGAAGSRATAVELGGSRMGSDEVLAVDAAALDGLNAEIVRRVASLPGADGAPCLAQSAVLGADLPTYALLYFPNADLVCPVDFAAVEGGADLAGRWGLSARVAREWGAPDPALLDAIADTGAEADVAELRVHDRWSAATLAAALRVVSTALLRHEAGGRVPVSPSQAQLWSLALFSAYNAMPSPAEGSFNASTERCVSQLLDDAVAAAPPAAPGEPLLPDLVAVASREIAVPARPTPGCPWPADALANGADAALRAVARLANQSP